MGLFIVSLCDFGNFSLRALPGWSAQNETAHALSFRLRVCLIAGPCVIRDIEIELNIKVRMPSF